MKNLSEVLKIVEHGLAGNSAAVRAYAQLLLEKRKAAGDGQAVALLEAKLGLQPDSEMAIPLVEQN